MKVYEALLAYQVPQYESVTITDIDELMAGRQEVGLEDGKVAIIKDNLAKLLEKKSFADWAKLVGGIFSAVKAETAGDAAQGAAAAK